MAVYKFFFGLLFVNCHGFLEIMKAFPRCLLYSLELRVVFLLELNWSCYLTSIRRRKKCIHACSMGIRVKWTQTRTELQLSLLITFCTDNCHITCASIIIKVIFFLKVNKKWKSLIYQLLDHIANDHKNIKIMWQSYCHLFW